MFVLVDGVAESLTCREGVKPFRLRLPLVTQDVNQLSASHSARNSGEECTNASGLVPVVPAL